MESIKDLVCQIEMLSDKDTELYMDYPEGYRKEITNNDKDYFISCDLSMVIEYYIKKFGFSFFFGALTRAVYKMDKKDLHKEKTQTIFSSELF